MRYPQPELAIIGTRRQQRFLPMMRTVTAYVKEEKVRLSLVLAFFGLHLPLAILMSRSVIVATLHALGTVAIGLWLAVSSEKLSRVVYATAYITGAEVLWRMTAAQSFWEIGKYGVAAVFIVAMIRRSRAEPALLPVLYFVLLLPSALLTIIGASLGDSRQMLSSNLSGPFALVAATCFFSQLTLTREEVVRTFLVLIGPVIGVAAVILFDMANEGEISFGTESSLETSGGFGPNQVSALLGLGVLTCFLLLLNERVDLKLRFLLGGLMIFLAAQSALTFSRGGLYNVVGAIFLASVFLLKDARTRLQFVVAVMLVVGVSYFLVFPRLDSYTGGALSARFEDTSPTGRDSIAMMDLAIWYENPIFGVGPGKAPDHRAEMGARAAAHTEFTRMLAEHGVFGLLALIALATAALRIFLKARSAMEKAFLIALMGWSFLFMLNAGMRIVAPSFVLGLAFATVATQRKVADSRTAPPARTKVARLLKRSS